MPATPRSRRLPACQHSQGCRPRDTPQNPADVTPAKAGAQSSAVPQKPSQAPQEPAKSAAAGPKLEGFAVQVGAFKDDEKLKQARERLAAVGVPHYTERRDGANGGRAHAAEKARGRFPTRARPPRPALAKDQAVNALDGPGQCRCHEDD